MRTPVGKSGRSRNQGTNGLISEEDRVAGGLGELLDAGRDVDGVADQGELELATAADGACDRQAGVDPDADPKRAVAKEFVDVPSGVDEAWHDVLEQRVEPGDGVLGGVRLGERGEVADVGEPHRHLAASSERGRGDPWPR